MRNARRGRFQPTYAAVSPSCEPLLNRGRARVIQRLSDSDLKDPQLKVRVFANDSTNSATALPDSDGAVKRVSEGVYDVTFSPSTLHATLSDNNLINNTRATRLLARAR